MKLGIQTGSVINHLYSRMTIDQPKPTVGMGATVLSWSDRYAGTITKVIEIGGSKVWLYEIVIREDDVKVIAGSQHDGSAEYEYTPDPDGRVYIFRYNRKNEEWVQGYISTETGRWKVSKIAKGVRIGERDQYFDPSF